jgi:hypothetical protein
MLEFYPLKKKQWGIDGTVTDREADIFTEKGK